MICLSRSARLPFAACVLSLGCSGRYSDADEGTERVKTALSISLPPGVIPKFKLNTPATAQLGSPFSASVSRIVPDVPVSADLYDWSGEGLRVAGLNGSTATLACTWSGTHTLEVLPKDASSGTPLRAQIDCTPPPCVGTAEECQTVDVSADPPTACPKTNGLLRVPTSRTCDSALKPSGPGGGEWVGGFLLDASDVAGGRFCAYSWVGAGQPPSPPAPLPDTTWQWDCPRVSAQAPANQLNQALASHGQAELGTLTWNTVPLSPVRIAVVDTAAGAWTEPDNNPHGLAVGALALDTACGGDQANCLIHTSSYLGLPLYRGRPRDGVQGAVIRKDLQHGGSFGARQHLVRAILKVIESAPNVRTVLNLSLSYEPDTDFKDQLAADFHPVDADLADRAVLDTLYRARCNGILIVTAAGNGPVPADPDQTEGFPARWTTFPALSKNECLRRFGVARFSDSTAPLLYAVSGLDYASRPLLTTRGKGQSTIAALGFQAVRELPNGSYTRRMTGTSMATAAVSGIVASLWSHVPSKAPDELMRALVAHGTPTAILPDFAPFPAGQAGPPLGDVRRLTRCSIADAFPALASCSLPSSDASVPGGTVPALPPGSPERVAQAPAPFDPGARPEDFPWIFPQPIGEPGCGACSLSLGRLNLAFRQSFPLNLISNLKLVAISNLALQSHTLLAAQTLNSGSSLEAAVPNPQLDPFGVTLDLSFAGATAAELTYQFKISDDTVIDATESVIIE